MCERRPGDWKRTAPLPASTREVISAALDWSEERVTSVLYEEWQLSIQQATKGMCGGLVGFMVVCVAV